MWRLRAIIKSEVEINPGEIQASGVAYNIFKIDEGNTLGSGNIPPTVRYCDIKIPSDTSDILEAFATLYDKLNTLLDRVALVSYGKTFVQNILSVTPASVCPNEIFQIAIPQFMFERKTKNLSLDSLGIGGGINDCYLRLERLMRLGLNAASEEEKYINYYSLLEEIARSESEDYIKNICKNCQHEVDTGRKKTNNHIKSILKSHGIENKLVNESSEIRNKIAHGGATKNKKFYSTVSLLNSHFEEVCLLELEKRIGITVINRLSAHIVEVPVITHKCRCNKDGTFDLVESSQRIPARFVKLKYDSDSIYKDTSALIGFPLDKEQRPIIDAFSWPNVRV